MFKVTKKSIKSFNDLELDLMMRKLRIAENILSSEIQRRLDVELLIIHRDPPLLVSSFHIDVYDECDRPF